MFSLSQTSTSPTSCKLLEWISNWSPFTVNYTSTCTQYVLYPECDPFLVSIHNVTSSQKTSKSYPDPGIKCELLTLTVCPHIMVHLTLFPALLCSYQPFYYSRTHHKSAWIMDSTLVISETWHFNKWTSCPPVSYLKGQKFFLTNLYLKKVTSPWLAWING